MKQFGVGDLSPCYVGRALRGRADNPRPSLPARFLLATLAILAPAGLIACGGGGERQDAGIESGDYTVRVVDAELERVQRLGKPTQMRLAVENSGSETIPDLAITVKVLGEEGEDSRDAFAYRDPQRNLNRHDRPIWIVEPGYPTLRDDPVLGSAETASARTFAFGELPAGETAEAIWQLTPVKAGNYRLRYEVSPDIYGVGEIEAEGGGAPTGVVATRILRAPQQLRVDERGRVVPAGRTGP